MKTPEQIAREHVVLMGYEPNDSIAQALVIAAIEADRAQRAGYTLASLDGTDDAAEWVQVGYVLDRADVEWLRGLVILP